MNWLWFLKPLDARLSDMCGGNIAVILAFSCGFAEIFAAIGFITCALVWVAPDLAGAVAVAVVVVVVVL